MEGLGKWRKAGKKKNFEQLVRDNQNKIYAICLNMLKNPQDAQDAAQDTFLKAYNGLDSFRGDSKTETWLMKIAMNVCRDMLRGRRPMLNIDDAYDLADEETTETAAERNARVDAVRSALGGLSEDIRTAVVLRYINGYSYEEVASILNINVGTVKSRLARGREKLKKILLENGELF